VEVEDGNPVNETVVVGAVRVLEEEGRERTGGPESNFSTSLSWVACRCWHFKMYTTSLTYSNLQRLNRL